MCWRAVDAEPTQADATPRNLGQMAVRAAQRDDEQKTMAFVLTQFFWAIRDEAMLRGVPRVVRRLTMRPALTPREGANLRVAPAAGGDDCLAGRAPAPVVCDPRGLCTHGAARGPTSWESERPMTDFKMAALAAAGFVESDPLVVVVAGPLGAGLRQLYALLWRAGLLEIID